MKRTPLLVTLTLAIAVTAGCATLDAKQREWIFQPSDRSWGGAQSTADMQDLWIDFQSDASGKAERLHGLWLAHERADAPVLLYLHGARWNVAGSSGRIRRMQELGFSVLAIDYRGFGQSSAGLPSEATASEDARAAWDWLAQQQPGKPRYIFGHSLGGAIAIDLAPPGAPRAFPPLSQRCALWAGGRSPRCGAALARLPWPGPRRYRRPCLVRSSGYVRSLYRSCWRCSPCLHQPRHGHPGAGHAALHSARHH